MTTRFISVMKNLIVMLKKRGFKMPKQIHFFDYNNIENFIKQQKGTFLCKNKKGEKVFVCITNEKIGVKELRIKIAQVNALRLKHAIFALETKETSYSKKLKSQHKNIQIERYLFKDLQISANKHSIVPKHVLLTNEQVKKVKKVFKIKEMPMIYSDDPQCKYHNAKPGDIMKIYRKDCIYYRAVVQRCLL